MNDERKKIMGFTVQDMLDMKLFQKGESAAGAKVVLARKSWCYDY